MNIHQGNMSYYLHTISGLQSSFSGSDNIRHRKTAHARSKGPASTVSKALKLETVASISCISTKENVEWFSLISMVTRELATWINNERYKTNTDIYTVHNLKSIPPMAVCKPKKWRETPHQFDSYLKGTSSWTKSRRLSRSKVSIRIRSSWTLAWFKEFPASLDTTSFAMLEDLDKMPWNSMYLHKVWNECPFCMKIRYLEHKNCRLT